MQPDKDLNYFLEAVAFECLYLNSVKKKLYVNGGIQKHLPQWPDSIFHRNIKQSTTVYEIFSNLSPF